MSKQTTNKAGDVLSVKELSLIPRTFYTKKKEKH